MIDKNKQTTKGCGAWTHYLALERFNAAVDVLVLLESAGRGEGLSTLRTGMAARADMLGTDVTLQVTRVSKNLVAVFARELPVCIVSELQ